MKINTNSIIRFFLFFLVVAGIIVYCIDGQPLQSSVKRLADTIPVHTNSQTSVARQEVIKKQSVTVDIEKEIAFLKDEIRRLSTQLAQQSARISLLDETQTAALSVEETQAIEATQADYELTNEMNQIQASDQMESYFTQQVENTAWASINEEAIRQSLGLEQNDLVSIVDLQCKSSLCRLELKYDLATFLNDNGLDKDGLTGFSTTVSGLLDSAVSQQINEAEQTSVAVIFLGHVEASASSGSAVDETG